MAADDTPERTVISLRIDQAQKNLIDAAARARGVSRTEFLLASARREAEAVLCDQRLFQLDAAALRRFHRLLDAPPCPNLKLRALLKRKAPWE